jgi:prolyl-tRNA synthetase
VPLRLTIGKRTIAGGEVEAQVRRGRVTQALPLDDTATKAAELWSSLA